MNLRHIVVAADESDAGRQAVRAGLDLAGKTSARLTVMRVVSVKAVPLPGAVTGDLGSAGPDGGGVALERLQQWLEADPQVLASPVPLTRSGRLQREVDPIRAPRTGSRGPADSRISVRQGLVVPEILAEVAASGPDVLAFGYHRGGAPGIIEGSSTARQLAHTAPVSVLAIPL